MPCWGVASLYAWNINATLFASLGVEASRLTGRHKMEGPGEHLGSFLVYLHL